MRWKSKLTPDQLAELKALEALTDVDINTADIPEAPEENWQYAVKGRDWAALRKELPEEIQRRLDEKRQQRKSI